MAVPTAITDLSPTPVSNSPSGGESIGTNMDDYLRAGFAFTRQVYNGTSMATSASVASATSTPIGAATSPTVTITGTTTITSFDAVAEGIKRDVTFSGALTLTHNATSLILPGSANITTAAGDSATFQSLGSGNWRCIKYQPAAGYQAAGSAVAKAGDTMSGALNLAPPATLASASTVNIGAASSNNITITGTTAITAFDTIAAGAVRVLTFSSALTLTHNATSFILPSASNITTSAGDVVTFQSLGSGNWRCIGYLPASGHSVITPIGIGQTWQNVTASRALATTYTNNSVKPIEICVTTFSTGGAASFSLTIGGVIVSAVSVSPSLQQSLTAIVPAGATYSANVSSTPSLVSWTELR